MKLTVARFSFADGSSARIARGVVFIAFAWSAACRGSAEAQDGAGREILKSALASFRSAEKRAKCTAANASQLAIQDPEKWAWFNGFRGKTLETDSNLRAVPELKDIPIPKAKTFSVAGKASPGDVLRVKWTDGGQERSSLLVYVGEETFPEGTQKHSFFIYPYRTQLEYNTIPARRHEAYMKSAEGVSQLGWKVLYASSDWDEKRQTSWLRPGVFGRETRLATTMLNDSARYTVYRGLHEGLDEYITLKERMPFHTQYFGPSSCFFAAYANVGTYKGFNPFPTDPKKRTSDDIIDYELALMRDELGTPTIDPMDASRKAASEIFRQWLFDLSDPKVVLKNKDFLVLQKARADDEQFKDANYVDLKNAIWGGGFVDYFVPFAADKRNMFNLKPLLEPIGNNYKARGSEVVKALETALRANEPVLATIRYNDSTNSKTWKDPDGVVHDQLELTLDNEAESSGHWIVITGLRIDNEGLADKKPGERVWVHLTADFFDEDPDGRFYMPLDMLLSVLPSEKKELKKLVVPDSWTFGSKVPEDTEELRASAFYTLPTKAVEIRNERPQRPPVLVGGTD